MPFTVILSVRTFAYMINIRKDAIYILQSQKEKNKIIVTLLKREKPRDFYNLLRAVVIDRSSANSLV